MNRLIIIGNGFDIAHGINTSFKGFIESYLGDFLNSFINSDYRKVARKYEGKSAHTYYHNDKLIEISSDYNLPAWLQFKSEGILEIFSKIEENKNITLSITPFFRRLYKNLTDKNWVDIELEYSKYLKENKANIGKINKVNEQFEYLKIKLIEYLKKQIESFNIGNYRNSDELLDFFLEDINPDEIYLHEEDSKEISALKNIHFLNFNYTNIIKDYVISVKNPECEINNIHGSLYDNHEEVVFGFGDEHDTDYLEFERMNNDEFLKFMKSFGYLQSERYKSLVNFINQGFFQVHIYGHSCGLSDRTMFNQIFEHKHCKSLKIFFYKKKDDTDDFTEKTYQLSRHFKNKITFRNILVPKNKSNPMPQPQRHY